MRLLWHSNSPWVPTGYGQQTALFASRLAELGHEIAISAFYGLRGAPMNWRGITVYPSHHDKFGNDAITAHVKNFGADLVITLCDVWVLDPEVFTRFRAACWTPVDCAPLSASDREWFTQSGATPIAMSRHGERELAAAGLRSHYVPHGVDTAVFAPADQAEARQALNIPADAFVVGINAANKGNAPSRKAFGQQLEAFARLRKRHSDALLSLHTDVLRPGDGVDVLALVKRLGIPEDAVLFCDQYLYRTGLLDSRYLATWYNACDVISNATYGEGFGLPTVEAQACSVPVVVCDNSASAELLGSGWKVKGHPHWVDRHHAWWFAPDVDQLARVYEKAYQGEAARRRGDRGREFAVGYDADRIVTEYWKPVLEELA